MKTRELLAITFVISVLLPAIVTAGIDIINVEPTPLFPKVEGGNRFE